ncbi:MAG: hypothetical protein F6J86_24610 [Symploca sp. SIO1B1]|nr:hypothetical protein [Symploca sp. SIO1A3]NER96993.1 hypothetical protein [Symploca sp. SIO1B1]
MWVVLSQEEFDHQRGYRFTLEIKNDHGAVITRSRANWLPPAPELIQYCQHCRESSHKLHHRQNRLRLEKFDDGEAENPIPPPPDYEMLQRLRESHAQAIEQRNDLMNNWLNSERFYQVKQAILDRSMEQEEIVVLIRIDRGELQRLPWAAWDLAQRRPELEFALLPLENE